VHFTERIRVGDAEIDRQLVARGVERIRETIEPRGVRLTFFEMATVLAFLAFAEAEVELAVLEVGLGGRLDATNVVEPIVSAVVSVDYDHEEFLGNTLDTIAREKAGVMRAGRVVVLGGDAPQAVRGTLLDEARRVGAIPVSAMVEEVDGIPIGLAGQHMRRNAAVALSLLREIGAARPELAVGGDAIRSGFAGVRWPGRLAVVGQRPLVICDAAHNLHGAHALARALPELLGSRKARLLFSALRDKPWREIVRILLPWVSQVTVAPLTVARGVPADELQQAISPSIETHGAASPALALRTMIEADRDTPILVTGSLFLVGAVYAEILARRGVESVFDVTPEEAA
jgi:dihydrofolate synthase/folylpolyglutamate synthase